MFLLLKQETEGITDNGVISALSYYMGEWTKPLPLSFFVTIKERNNKNGKPRLLQRRIWTD